MAKDYGMVSWSYTCLVMRRMGFGEMIIDMIWRLMSNNWYSIIINGSRHGFFHSTRGLKKEVLTKMLNNLHQHYLCKGFHMERNVPQLINKEKSQLLIPEKTPPDIIERTKAITEGGIGMKNLGDMCLSLHYKQWWNFRSKKSLWGNFLKAKYCQRANFVIKKWNSGQSLTWKNMIINRIEAINSGSCSVWWDDWLGVGSLANNSDYLPNLNNVTVSSYLVNGEWNEDRIRQRATQQLIHKILHTNKPTTSGSFTCASAWEHVRKKRNKTLTDSLIWHKVIPFKEDVDHIFISGKFAKPFANRLGNRFASKYGGKQSSTTRVKFFISKELHMLIITTYPFIKLPNNWNEFISLVENYQHDIKVTQVNWWKLPQSIVKLNTDGRALENPGRIGAGGILRDHKGKLIYAYLRCGFKQSSRSYSCSLLNELVYSTWV
ncbi:hypothetical protein H5410_047175 [Solanum commersonii]|uniref:Uncharacterized protein n=1 Tax=Solanum commersonii TaxID=4109 RepID=A0A9J5XGC5_SOLCO|nr:hypothetical protein H5410_047175 [Solanum commersonii]